MKGELEGISGSVSRIGTHVDEESASAERSNSSVAAIGKVIEALRSAIDEQAESVTESSAGIEQMIQSLRTVASNVEQVDSSYEGGSPAPHRKASGASRRQTAS